MKIGDFLIDLGGAMLFLAVAIGAFQIAFSFRSKDQDREQGPWGPRR